MLGGEFNKTKGHCHIGAYPEIYTVLKGQAIYLQQKNNNAVSCYIHDFHTNFFFFTKVKNETYKIWMVDCRSFIYCSSLVFQDKIQRNKA